MKYIIKKGPNYGYTYMPFGMYLGNKNTSRLKAYGLFENAAWKDYGLGPAPKYEKNWFKKKPSFE